MLSRIVLSLMLGFGLMGINASIAPDKSKSIVLAGEIAEDTIMSIQRALDQAHGLPIKLYISSPGGYVDAGEVVISLLNYYAIKNNTTISCIVPDAAYSMAASIILDACTSVEMDDGARLMFHNAKVCPGLFGNCVAWWQIDLSKPQFQGTQWKIIKEELYQLDLKLAMMLAKRTGLSVDAIMSKLNIEWWMQKTEACTLKLANKEC